MRMALSPLSLPVEIAVPTTPPESMLLSEHLSNSQLNKFEYALETIWFWDQHYSIWSKDGLIQ